MKKSSDASTQETKGIATEELHVDVRRHWLRLFGAIGGGLLLVGAAVTVVILIHSQASTITGLKDDKAGMAKELTSSHTRVQRTKLALTAITVQLAKTKRALAVEKRKAANQFGSGFTSGYTTGQGDTSTAYNDGYSAGYNDGYNKGLCIDPSNGNYVC